MATPRKSLSELARASAQQETKQPKPEPTPEPTPEAMPAADISAAIRSRLLANKAPRPPKPKKLSVELDPDFYNAVVARAKADDITLAELTRHLLRIYLES